MFLFSFFRDLQESLVFRHLMRCIANYICFLFLLTFRFIISFSGNRVHLSPIVLIFRKSSLV